MDIHKAIAKLPAKRREYFKWKFDLYVNLTEKPTEAELCEKLKVKTLNHMKKWERSEEYLALVHLYVQSQSAKDLEQIYAITSKKALEGDEKAIKLLLELQKQSRAFNNANKVVEQENNAYDDLEL